MEYINVGKIVNTHGLKGEIRILSSFPDKEKVIIPGKHIYIGDDYYKVKIISHRVHKNYNMVTLENYNDINSVLPFKGKKVYVLRSEITRDGPFDEDYIGLKAYSDRYLGNVTKIIHQHAQDILVIEKEGREYLVPKVDAFIKKVDLKNHKIEIDEIEGLFNEN